MEKRIKIIYRFTIVALIALVVVQGYWLFNQYVYTLQKYENELFQKTIDVTATDRELRRDLKNEHVQVKTQWQMKVLQNDRVTSTPEIKYIFDTYTIDRYKIKDSISIKQADSLSKLDAGIKKCRFIIKEQDKQYNVFDALEQFRVNELCPFQVERFDSLLREHRLNALSIKIETTDSMTWVPSILRHTSILSPTIEVIYPYNILGKEQIRITYKLDLSPIFGKMIESLIGSIILSFLLVFCLVYQTKTIYKQRRIEELRKDFIKTMIHELKRPVSTLKLCISFMKNDKMMKDKQMKEDIIHSSQNELDNLSSYFSKLRDLTYGDMEEIPLNFSTFNIKELVAECIDKQKLPTDRKIIIDSCVDVNNTKITADRMHVSNILCNLLENAVKYSEGETSIHVNCYSVGKKYKIEVADNGFGIPPAEC
ncbi:MAG: HAMP domain-containing sensor histidine kinase, partial [Massilibacteroides sp.]|nr:HAMP domain-containing sensor histidine kinase [Massilibacteroides sp.]